MKQVPRLAYGLGSEYCTLWRPLCLFEWTTINLVEQHGNTCQRFTYPAQFTRSERLQKRIPRRVDVINSRTQCNSFSGKVTQYLAAEKCHTTASLKLNNNKLQFTIIHHSGKIFQNRRQGSCQNFGPWVYLRSRICLALKLSMWVCVIKIDLLNSRQLLWSCCNLLLNRSLRAKGQDNT